MNEQFFKMEQVLKQREQKQSDKVEEMNKTVSGQLVTLEDKLNHMESISEGKLAMMEQQIIINKKQYISDSEQLLHVVNEMRKDSEAIKSSVKMVEVNLRSGLQVELANMQRIVDKFQKEVVDTYLRVTEDHHDEGTFTVCNKSLKTYCFEKFANIKNNLQMIKEQIYLNMERDKRKDQMQLSSSMEELKSTFQMEILKQQNLIKDNQFKIEETTFHFKQTLKEQELYITKMKEDSSNVWADIEKRIMEQNDKVIKDLTGNFKSEIAEVNK